VDELVLPDHDLPNELAVAQLDILGVVQYDRAALPV
jgi:hypothetical protein